MRAIRVVGDGNDDLAARLGPALPGRTAVVRPGADVETPDGSATTYWLDGETWRAAGTGQSLDGALDDLTPTHDYALVLGGEAPRLPAVAVGDADPEGRVCARVETADGADLDRLGAEIREVEPRVTLSSLVARAKAADEDDRAGAVATFTGRVRAHDDPDDPRTTRLEFEKYEDVADERLAALREELVAREDVQEVLLHHRTGVVEAGEDIVFVVVLAGHREAAFRTVEDGIDRLKAEVPLFKKEVTVEDEYWVHERE